MTGKMAHNPERLPPIHPGKILNEDFLLPMKITQYRLAKAIGVDARRIHSIVHGQRSITAETALLLARFFGNSPAFWAGLQTQYDLETAEDRLSHKLEMVKTHSPPTCAFSHGRIKLSTTGNRVRCRVLALVAAVK